MRGRKIEYENPVIDRLKSALKIKTDAELAEMLNVTRTAISHYRKSNSYPKKLLNFAIQKGINIYWLLTGEGEPFIQQKSGEKEPQELVKIPFLDAIAGAGTTGGFLSDEIVENVYFPSTIIRHLSAYRPQDIFLIIVSGDSMSPTILPGDICIVQKYRPGEQLKSGSIYIIRNHYELLVKRVDFYRDKVILRSDNKKISDDVITKEDFDQLEILAHVLAIIRII